MALLCCFPSSIPTSLLSLNLIPSSRIIAKILSQDIRMLLSSNGSNGVPVLLKKLTPDYGDQTNEIVLSTERNEVTTISDDETIDQGLKEGSDDDIETANQELEEEGEFYHYIKAAESPEEEAEENARNFNGVLGLNAKIDRLANSFESLLQIMPQILEKMS